VSALLDAAGSDDNAPHCLDASGLWHASVLPWKVAHLWNGRQKSRNAVQKNAWTTSMVSTGIAAS